MGQLALAIYYWQLQVTDCSLILLFMNNFTFFKKHFKSFIRLNCYFCRLQFMKSKILITEI